MAALSMGTRGSFVAGSWVHRWQKAATMTCAWSCANTETGDVLIGGDSGEDGVDAQDA